MIAKKQKNRKRFFSPERKGFFWTILLLISIVFLISTNLKLNQERQKVMAEMKEAKKSLAASIEKEEKLNNLLSHISSAQALEKAAREDLNLQKPGEKILVVKKEEESKNSTSSQKENTGFSFQNIIDWIKEKTGI